MRNGKKSSEAQDAGLGDTVASTTQQFGEVLGYLRRIRGLTQAELGKRVKHTREYIGLLESNQSLPKLNEVVMKFVPALSLSDEPALARLLMLAARNAFHKACDLPLVTVTNVAAPASPSPQPNLPKPKYALLGRDTAVTELTQLISHPPAQCLLSIVGPPGVGKTRLAIEIAQHCRARQRVVFVELAGAVNVCGVIQALAQAMHVPTQTGKVALPQADLQMALLTQLGRQATLIVLDNFEHLLAADREVADWLNGWRLQSLQTQWLVTSRQALQLPNEYVYELQPLAFDQLDAPALHLFAERARAVSPYFKLTPHNWLQVSHICGKLEGLPLAIELMAGQMRHSPFEKLLDWVNVPSQLSHLTNAHAQGCTRHRTLCAAVEWSYDLLQPAEQALLRRMAVCVGSAEEDCIVALNSPCEAAHTHEALLALVDKNLCRRINNDGPPNVRGKHRTTRFGLFEAVREFARTQLSDDERALAQQNLFEYVYALAQNTQKALHTADEAAWLQKLERNDGNVRETLTWASQHDRDRALGLCVCLGDFWLMRGLQLDGQRWLKPLLMHFDVHTAQNQHHQAQALSLMGYLTQQQANLPEADLWLGKALALAQQIHNLDIVFDVHNCLGWNAYQLGDYAQAQTHFAGFLAAARRLGKPEAIAQALSTLVQIKLDLGDNSVNALLREAQTLFLKVGDQRGLAYWARLYSRWWLRQNNPLQAINWLGYALELDLVTGYRFYEGLTCMDLARLHWAQGELAQAQIFSERALAIFSAANLPFGMAGIQRVLGLIDLAAGKLADAEQHLNECVRLAMQTNYKQCLAEASMALAQVKIRQGQQAEAMRHFMLAEQMFAALPPYLDPPDLAFRQQVALALDSSRECARVTPPHYFPSHTP